MLYGIYSLFAIALIFVFKNQGGIPSNEGRLAQTTFGNLKASYAHCNSINMAGAMYVPQEIICQAGNISENFIYGVIPYDYDNLNYCGTSDQHPEIQACSQIINWSLFEI